MNRQFLSAESAHKISIKMIYPKINHDINRAAANGEFYVEHIFKNDNDADKIANYYSDNGYKIDIRKLNQILLFVSVGELSLARMIL